MPDGYDVVVVGGGIHGVGVAQAAAARGHRVLLLEQTGLAAGTSSRSSKLIHGGLRYLESGELSLVRECLRERALLLRLAPGLVHLERFTIPVFKTTRRRPWKIRAGLSLYAVLAGLQASARFRRVPRSRWGELDGLVTRDLQAVFEYHDARTDDAALTAAVMASARSLGAELAMPATFEGARIGAEGCVVDYRREGRERSCRCAVLVNAAGPWAGRVLATIRPASPPRRVDLVQGAHIVLRGRPRRGVYYVEAPSDGRAVFVMPWGDDTLVGTTETPFEGDPAGTAPRPQELAYLAEVVDTYFPGYGATRDGAIVSSFAGLRVLPAGDGWAFRRSRETILDVDDAARPRVLTIYGGKLTAYRATAEKVMRRLGPSLPARPSVADTAALPLNGEAPAAPPSRLPA